MVLTALDRFIPTYRILISCIAEVEVVAQELAKALLGLVPPNVNDQRRGVVAEEDRMPFRYCVWVLECDLRNGNEYKNG